MVIFSPVLNCAYAPSLTELLIADNTTGFWGGWRNLQTLQIRLIEKWAAADRDPSEA